jgi:hypothetical protein
MIIISILSGLVGLVNLAVFIMVLIKLFQKEGTLKGVLGLICALYTFIWGWMHATELNIKNYMLIWTGLIILSIILAVINSVLGAAAANSSGTLLQFFA